jgi:hypothetical protein
MWPDNETVEDLIGFRVHAELIADVVSDPKLLPVTMGLFGEWGNGKTSIMKMLQKQLTQDEGLAVLYFDAWLFEGYDDAKSALISSILKQLTKHKRFPQALKARAARLLERVNWMRILKMGWDKVALPAVLAYATGGATAVPRLGARFKGDKYYTLVAWLRTPFGGRLLKKRHDGDFIFPDHIYHDDGDADPYFVGQWL